MLKDDLYYSHLLVPKTDGTVARHQAGRFLVKDGSVHHLEDYHGHQEQTIPAGAIDDYTEHKIKNPGPHLSVASHHDIATGSRLDFVPAHKFDKELTPPIPTIALPPKPVSVWHYRRSGHDSPHTLEVKAGKYLLDGNPLTDSEVSTILDNVRNKVATIRYPQQTAHEAVAKMEAAFLGKAMDVKDAFQLLHGVRDAGHLPAEAVESLRRHIYHDPMVPDVGNKYAWEEFKAKNTPGTYISLDGNSFKSINDSHGHQAGDDAIRAFGNAARDAISESVGTKNAKMFRTGGDEFVVHVPSYQHGAHFARALRNRLEQVPPVGGTHKLSMAMGFGHDYLTADKALGMAKQQKYHPSSPGDEAPVPRWKPGQEPSLAHSLVSTFEGPVPLHDEQASVPAVPAPPKPQPKVA